LNNLAAVLIHDSRFEEALEFHDRGLHVDPGSAYLHWSRALAWLTLGDFERGWPEFEWRLKWNPKKLARDFAQPQWDGSGLAGRTILIHAEGGFGDVLQFVRFAPWVKRCGGRVVLECQPELVSLLESVEGIDEVVARGRAPLPAFDVHCALQSLPAVLRLRFEQIPASIPYLAVDAEGIAAARKRVEGDGARLRVGLVWSGSAKPQRINNPNLTLSAFASLAEVPGVVFYGLQKGEPAREAMKPPAGAKFVDVGASLADFAETAAFVEALDLVITVDTSTAHLAAALGRPVWVLLAYSPDFRWLLDRTDSPWYPTMRLFRQSELGDWASVFAQVTGALRQLATTGVQCSGDSG
jgi:hypothetical protein